MNTWILGTAIAGLLFSNALRGSLGANDQGAFCARLGFGATGGRSTWIQLRIENSDDFL
jgi:hypothetical protein